MLAYTVIVIFVIYYIWWITFNCIESKHQASEKKDKNRKWNENGKKQQHKNQ